MALKTEHYLLPLKSKRLQLMSVPTCSFPARELVRFGLRQTEGIHYQSTPEQLVEDALRMGEGQLNDTGALVIKTGEFTGRSPKDKFIVYEEATAKTIDWNEFNHPIDPKHYAVAYKKIMDYLDNKKDLWIRDCSACADERYKINIRLVTEKPWMSLFAHNMFLRPEEKELENFKPEWHIFSAPDLKLNAEECGTRMGNAAIICFSKKTILIAGTGYTGETKKGIFSVRRRTRTCQMRRSLTSNIHLSQINFF